VSKQSAQEKLDAATRAANEAYVAYEASGYRDEEGRAWSQAKRREDALSLLAPRGRGSR
jgi:hypothetical protein